MNKTFTLSEILLFTPEKFLKKLEQGEIELTEPREQVVKSIIKMAKVKRNIKKYNIQYFVNF